MEDNIIKADFSKSEITDDTFLENGFTYKGKFYYQDGKITPHGWGRLRNEKGDIIQGYFVNGKIGKAAIKAYKGSNGGWIRSYVGQVDENVQPHGFGMEVCYGEYVSFGYYKHGTLYNDLSSLGRYIFDQFKSLDWGTFGLHKDNLKYVVAYGGDDGIDFRGLLFYDNGDVLIHEGDNRKVLFPTGHGVKINEKQFEIFGPLYSMKFVEFVDIKNGEVVNWYLRKTFTDTYNWKLFDEKIIDKKIENVSCDKQDGRLYKIEFVANNCVEIDILNKQFIFVKAVSLNNITWENEQIKFQDDFLEYFYFENDPMLFKSLVDNLDRNFIQIHLEDYTWYEGFIGNLDYSNEDDIRPRYVHFHKKIFGWNCEKIDEWDPLTIPQRHQLIKDGKYDELFTREFDLNNNHDAILKILEENEKHKE